MGQQQSKDELLYQQVSYGNIEGIKALRTDGAGLEWTDKEGKTPLIAACMNPELYQVSKTLIELGANVNAYRPGRHAGTPLHHAAKRGLDQTVKLLLSHGANALVMNEDCQTPLDVARIKGYSNVVRTIESHLCLFSGWLRELYGPGFLELLAPQLLSRKVWVVVVPCGSRNLKMPFKLELAIYTSVQDAQPRTIVALWKANLDEPNFNQSDPTVIISDASTIPRRWRRRRGIMYSQVARRARRNKYIERINGQSATGITYGYPFSNAETRIKLAAASESNKQQLQWFCNACKGIPQVVHSTFPFNPQVPAIPPTAPPTHEDAELSMAINASLQTAAQEGPLHLGNQPLAGSGAGASTSITNFVDVTMDPSCHTPGASSPQQGNYKGCNIQEVSPSSVVDPRVKAQSGSSAVQTTIENLVPDSVPSVPLADAVIDNDGPIHYPQIDATPLDLVQPPLELSDTVEDERKETGTSSCVICLDAPVEGACIPCGHMAGCMSCLNEIKGKKWGCPVCRAKIDQVVRLYAV